MTLTLQDVDQSINNVDKYHTPYDMNVMRLDDRYIPATSATRGYPLDQLSCLVYTYFTKVAVDYYCREIVTPSLIKDLEKRYPQYKFWEDDYKLDRKQLAVLANLGKITKPSLVFSRKFGLNCKIDAIFTNAPFDKYTVFTGRRYFNPCIKCPAPCEIRCPVGCKMNYSLNDKDAKKCDTYITRHWNKPENHCRICQEACPYSEKLLDRIPKKFHVRLWKPHPNDGREWWWNEVRHDWDLVSKDNTDKFVYPK